MKNIKEHVLNSSLIGLEIEFLTKLDSVSAARSLTKNLGTKVVVPYEIDNFNKYTVKRKSPIIPTSEIFKLELDYSGGVECHELITGPLNYKKARNVLIKTFNWIKENGWTTERCSIHLNISFDKNKIKLKNSIGKINILKFCLDIDELSIYNKFPNRIESIYANSIKNILLNNIFYISSVDNNQFKVPDKKYYGVNFKKLEKEYLEFRYVGGKDYENKIQNILDINDYFILFLYDNIQNLDLTENNKRKIKQTIDKNKIYLDVYKNPEMLSKNFPELYVSVDLNENIDVIKTYWHQIKDKVIKIMIRGGVKKGSLNYDTELSRLQVKDVDFYSSDISGFELINCTGHGYISNCHLYDCNFTQVLIDQSEIISGNSIKNSKITDSNANQGNLLENCYIENFKTYIIDCKVEGGIFRKGTFGENIEISKETNIIDYNELTNKEKLGKRIGVYKKVDNSQYKEHRYLQITKGK